MRGIYMGIVLPTHDIEAHHSILLMIWYVFPGYFIALYASYIYSFAAFWNLVV